LLGTLETENDPVSDAPALNETIPL